MAIARIRTLSDHNHGPYQKYLQENIKHATRSVLVKLKKYGLVSRMTVQSIPWPRNRLNASKHLDPILTAEELAGRLNLKSLL
jgi:hypothetical protein